MNLKSKVKTLHEKDYTNFTTFPVRISISVVWVLLFFGVLWYLKQLAGIKQLVGKYHSFLGLMHYKSGCYGGLQVLFYRCITAFLRNVMINKYG